MPTVGSLFSGVGGFDLGFERAGFKVAYQVEFDTHAQSVLRRHWPDTTLFEDVRDVGSGNLPAVDVLVGGFPCQDLSVAGRRAGLTGERSGLFYEFARIIEESHPEWVVIENVPGLLSSRGGRDMGAVLGTLSDLGYGWAYRVLDSQYFGVPQRRRRVFIVGRAGGRSRSCAEILFEPESVLGNPPPSRTPGQEVAGSLGGGAGNRGWCNDLDRSGAFVAAAPTHDVSPTLIGAPGRGDDGSDAYVVGGIAVRTAQAGSNGWGINESTAYTLDGANGQAVLAIEDPAGKMSGGPGNTQVEMGCIQPISGIVRRLTPKECERLQGFPDDWTAGQADSHRYRQMGNAVTVPVAEWIGQRLMAAIQPTSNNCGRMEPCQAST